MAIHSAHFAKPFKALMYERQKQDVLKTFPDPAKVEFLREKKEGAPRVVGREEKDGRTIVTLVAPQCMIGSWS